jgi:nucleoside-diphosphate-sugar epimerase
MRRLATRGVRVRGVCRSGKAEAPEGAEVAAGDIGNAGRAEELCHGAEVVYGCLGVDYTRWPELWPPIVDGLLAGAAAAGARLVFADNLYSYGPHDAPLTEDLLLTEYGKKPALRARMTERFLQADSDGRVPVALVRASDFYGPRALNSLLGERVFPMAPTGKKAQLIGDIDQPHTYTYVGDFARALVSVAEDPEAMGQIWHVPSSPARSTREVVEMIYDLAGSEAQSSVLPEGMLTIIGLFSPMMRQLKEMRFTRDRPYIVDHTKFAARFWDDWTPLEDGLRATLEWYQDRA